MSLFDQSQQPRNLLGRVLPVGINGNQDGGAACNRLLNAGSQHRALTEIACVHNRDLAGGRACVVRRAVIDDQHGG